MQEPYRLVNAVELLFLASLFAEQRSGSLAEHVSKRRKKATRSEAKRQTEAAAYVIAPTMQRFDLAVSYVLHE